MRHVVGYHNMEKMGRSPRPLRLLSKKRLNLLDCRIWLVIGEGANPRRYTLGSVFRVASIEDTNQDGFSRCASGPGHVFDPAVPIGRVDWFEELLRATNRFSLGAQPIKNDAIIAGLVRLATEAGVTDLDFSGTDSA